MREYLLRFWGSRYRMKSISADYLRGYAHALNDAGIIDEDKQNQLLEQLKNRDNIL